MVTSMESPLPVPEPVPVSVSLPEPVPVPPEVGALPSASWAASLISFEELVALETVSTPSAALAVAA